MIVHSARDVGLPGVDADTGFGLLDVKAALAADPSILRRRADRGDRRRRAQGRPGVFVRVTGTANTDRLASARIELGQGESPSDVAKRLAPHRPRGVRDGVLDDLPAQNFAGAPVWTLRLIVEHTNGKRRETRHVLRLG